MPDIDVSVLDDTHCSCRRIQSIYVGLELIKDKNEKIEIKCKY